MATHTHTDTLSRTLTQTHQIHGTLIVSADLTAFIMELPCARHTGSVQMLLLIIRLEANATNDVNMKQRPLYAAKCCACVHQIDAECEQQGQKWARTKTSARAACVGCCCIRECACDGRSPRRIFLRVEKGTGTHSRCARDVVPICVDSKRSAVHGFFRAALCILNVDYGNVQSASQDIWPPCVDHQLDFIRLS